MRDLGDSEQPKLTEEDIRSILSASALDPERPMPARWRTGNVSAETRLKFNAPTPVLGVEVTMEWDAPSAKVLVFHTLLWLVDGDWEVFSVEDTRV